MSKHSGGLTALIEGLIRPRRVTAGNPYHKGAGPGGGQFTSGGSGGGGSFVVQQDKDYGSWGLQTRDYIRKSNRNFEPSGEQVSWANDAIKSTSKTVDLKHPLIWIGPNGENLGSQVKGLTIISPKAIEKAVHAKISDAEFFHMYPSASDRTVKDAFQHVLRHELGHRYDQNTGIGTEWKPLDAKYGHKISMVAQMYHNPRESFADAFAIFTSGGNLPNEVEQFFMMRVK